MIVGYVSDERYIALADVGVEFEQDGKLAAVTKSTPRGGIYAELAPGKYRVTLVKDGYGSKHVTLDVAEGKPYQFRLLADRILGYMWPKWVKAGEKSEFRIHSPEAYRLSLWRYGLQKEFVRLISWIDEHGPRANVQLTPDGDYTQTGVKWNKIGYGSPQHHQLLTGPQRSGLYYLHAEGESGAFFHSPGWSRRPRPKRRSPCSPPRTPGMPTTTLAGAAITSTVKACRRRRRSTPARIWCAIPTLARIKPGASRMTPINRFPLSARNRATLCWPTDLVTDPSTGGSNVTWPRLSGVY